MSIQQWIIFATLLLILILVGADDRSPHWPHLDRAHLQRLLRLKEGATVKQAALTGIVAGMSAFVKNSGALALLIPVALRVA